jgi:NAD(P)H-quinone oxidoreductase subunit I
MSESAFDSVVRFLSSLFRGLKTLTASSAELLKHFWGIGESHKKVTEQYPDPVSSRTEDDLPSRTRGILVNDIEKCTACGDCRKICPTQCIRIETLPSGDIGRPLISVFDIDLGRCLFCGLCVETCHPNSLTHTKRFEGAVYQSKDLVLRYGKGVEELG